MTDFSMLPSTPPLAVQARSLKPLRYSHALGWGREKQRGGNTSDGWCQEAGPGLCVEVKMKPVLHFSLTAILS